MDYQLIKPINEDYNAIEQILTNRGFKLEDIQHYLHTTEEDENSPSLLMNVDKAIALILKHLAKENNRIFIQVDADCDGFTSSALLINYLHKAFPSSTGKIYYAFHPDKSHGIDVSKILDGTTLVIAPDASSNEYEIHQSLQERGMDVLVMDHHLSDKISPYACVVNNQLCDYPNKTLSGVGVVYKVCERFDEIRHTAYTEELVDLAMLGLELLG